MKIHFVTRCFDVINAFNILFRSFVMGKVWIEFWVPKTFVLLYLNWNNIVFFFSVTLMIFVRSFSFIYFSFFLHYFITPFAIYHTDSHTPLSLPIRIRSFVVFGDKLSFSYALFCFPSRQHFAWGDWRPSGNCALAGAIEFVFCFVCHCNNDHFLQYALDLSGLR